MPCVGFEPTIPASEREKTAHALERSATVTGTGVTLPYLLLNRLYTLICGNILFNFNTYFYVYKIILLVG
jgi:hypothetical protein